MTNAPSVACPVVRSPTQFGLMALIWLGGAMVTALWFAQSPAGDRGPILSTVALMLGGGMGVWRWRTSPVGTLRWDGVSWFWLETAKDAAQDEFAVTLRVVLDMQRHVLVRCRAAGGRCCWLWLSRKNCGQNWLALRRAAFFSKQNEVRPTNGSSAQGAVPAATS